MWTLRFSLLMFACMICLGLAAGYLTGVFYPGLIAGPSTANTSSRKASRAAVGVMVNLPRVVASLDDGQEFYSVQATIALEIDHAGTAALIRARHEVITRHLTELLHTYRVQDLRAGGQPSTLREDIKRSARSFPRGRCSTSISPIGW